MFRRFTKFAVPVCVGGVLSISCGCGVHDDEQIVRIAHCGYIFNLPFMVASEAGFFHNHGLDVQIVDMGDPITALNALTGGSVDVVSQLPIADLLSAAGVQQDQLRLFGLVSIDDSLMQNCILVKKGAKLTSIEQLSGKTIAAPLGGLDVYLRCMLREAGLPESETRVEALRGGIEEGLEGLRQGRIHALFTIGSPLWFSYNSEVANIMLEDPLAIYGIEPLVMASAAVASTFRKKHPERFEKLCDALTDAVNLLSDDRAQARRTLVELIDGEVSETEERTATRHQADSQRVGNDNMGKLAEYLREHGGFPSGRPSGHQTRRGRFERLYGNVNWDNVLAMSRWHGVDGPARIDAIQKLADYLHAKGVVPVAMRVEDLVLMTDGFSRDAYVQETEAASPE